MWLEEITVTEISSSCLWAILTMYLHIAGFKCAVQYDRRTVGSWCRSSCFSLLRHGTYFISVPIDTISVAQHASDVWSVATVIWATRNILIRISDSTLVRPEMDLFVATFSSFSWINCSSRFGAVVRTGFPCKPCFVGAVEFSITILWRTFIYH